MFRLTFNSSDVRLAAAIRAKSGNIATALAVKMNVLMIQLQKKIVTEKLSGQVLHHRTGTLAGSITVEDVGVTDGMVTGRVTGAGGPAWYGRVHEFGGTHEYEIRPVNKKALAFFPGGSVGAISSKASLRGMFKGGELRTSATRRFANMGGVVVKSVIHPPLPERSFMRVSLQESHQHIVEELAKAVRTGLKKKKG